LNKPDLPLGCRLGRLHQLAHGVDEPDDRLTVAGELLADARLQLSEPAGEVRVRGDELAQLHEGAHDTDAHLDRAGRIELGSHHQRAVLDESRRQRW
jgi:hypothetical protein